MLIIVQLQTLPIKLAILIIIDSANNVNSNDNTIILL